MNSIRFKLVKGSEYVLHDVGSYTSRFLVVDVYPEDNYSRYNSVLRSVYSGWTFIAHGTNIYEDGTIDWDFSTNGRFEK